MTICGSAVLLSVSMSAPPVFMLFPAADGRPVAVASSLAAVPSPSSRRFIVAVARRRFVEEEEEEEEEEEDGVDDDDKKPLFDGEEAKYAAEPRSSSPPAPYGPHLLATVAISGWDANEIKR